MRFWRLAERLKREPRRGWIGARRIRRVESVADHSFALALLALFEGERRGYDVERILKLALVHDLEEAVTRDLTPADKSRLGAKRVELDRQKATDEILAAFPARSRLSYRELWMDLKLRRSREARLVHQLDKVEMAFQAHEYGKLLGKRMLQGFYASAALATTDRMLKRSLARLTGEGLG